MTTTRFDFTTRARPIMEVGIGSSVIDLSAALWDVALWDAPTSTWNGDEPLWRDVSCDVIEAHIDLGRGRITDSFPVGVASITIDNISGWADPSIEPDDDFVMRMGPGRPIRIGVAHQTLGDCWLYCGFIDSIEPVDDPEDWSIVTMECVDALGEAGRAKLAATVETGTGEQSGTRFARILDMVSWPSTKRSISPTATRELYAAELDGQVVDLLRQTAESEGGWAFADTDGNIVLQHRDWLYHVVGEPVDGVIGNFYGANNLAELLLENGTALLLESGDEMVLENSSSSSDVCPGQWRRSFDRKDITTRVILDRDVPTDFTQPVPGVANDPDAQIIYGIEPYERLDLWTLNRSDLMAIAGIILASRAAVLSMPRIRSVSLDASTSDAAIDLMSSLSIFTPSRYRCRLETERGLVFDANFYAVGVTHNLSAEGWNADISLDRSTPFEILDPADYIWDTAIWDRSLWN